MQLSFGTPFLVAKSRALRRRSTDRKDHHSEIQERLGCAHQVNEWTAGDNLPGLVVDNADLHYKLRRIQLDSGENKRPAAVVIDEPFGLWETLGVVDGFPSFRVQNDELRFVRNA